MKGILSDKTMISAELRGDFTFFEVTGTAYGLAEVTEQLLWVSTALQTPGNTPGASLDFAIPSGTFVTKETIQPSPEVGIPQSRHVGTAHCTIKFKREFLGQEAPLARGYCWHKLFRSCAIVSGYPILSRPPQRPGLEVPFDMMAALAGAERITRFCGNLVVKGFSTLLYPTCHENGFMSWHLIYNEDGSRVSFADDRVSLADETKLAMSQLQPDDTNHARHIVGWAAALKNNTGMYAFG